MHAFAEAAHRPPHCPPCSFIFRSRFVHDLTLDVFSQVGWGAAAGAEVDGSSTIALHRLECILHPGPAFPVRRSACITEGGARTSAWTCTARVSSWFALAAVPSVCCMLKLMPPQHPPSAAVHNNLLANVNVGAATRPFLSSGAAPRGAHAGRTCLPQQDLGCAITLLMHVPLSS